ncbi:MAG: hypothetical protein WCO42_10840, partial [bacterium]
PEPSTPPAPIPPASSTAQLTPPPKTGSNSPSPAQQPDAPKKAAAPIVLGQVPDASTGANISVTCPACHWQTKVSQTLIGKKIRCKQCSGIVVVAAPTLQNIPEVPVAAAPPPIPPPPPTPEPEPSLPPALPTVTLNAELSTLKISPGTTVLLGEIANLKAKLETTRKESVTTALRLEEAQKKAQHSEMRAREAEKTLHDLAGKTAIENMSANRKIAELETRIGALTHSLSTLANEFDSELDYAEQKVTRLRETITRYNATMGD